MTQPKKISLGLSAIFFDLFSSFFSAVATAGKKQSYACNLNIIIHSIIIHLYYWCDKNRVSLEIIK